MGLKGNFAVSRRKVIAGLVAGFCVGGSHAEERTLETVNVSADAVQEAWMGLDRDAVHTVYRVGPENLRVFDNPGGTNPYTAIAEIPGVRVNTIDAYGLNNQQGGQKGLRVRGEVSTHGTSGTVEGLALGGPGPGPGYMFLFDKENLAAISFSQGAVAADQAGLFNSYGALDSQLLWPRSEALRQVSVSTGSNRFQRYFARLDTGESSAGTSMFISASDTSADKWRGQGKAPSSRNNVELALGQKIGSLGVKLLYAQNDQAQHAYKALTYAEVTNLSSNFYNDYSNNRASSDYYDYNRQDFRNQVLLAELEYAFSPQTSVVFKPYLAKEEGYYLYAGTTATQLQKWLLDHETYGLTGEVRTVLADTKLKLGYSWTSTAPPGPPTTRKQYLIAGGGVRFDRWSLLSKLVDRHEFENFYFTAQRRFGALTVQGGARYARETLPSITAYNAGAATAGSAWDISIEDAIARATVDPKRSVTGRSFGNWLPQLAVGYEINPAVEVHGSLGRNVGAPSFDAFNQTPAATGPLSTSQGFWDRLQPELTTNLDLGTRLRFGKLTLDPTIYFSKSKNKAVRVYDPALANLWTQNIGNTRAKGVQLAAAWTPLEALRVFGSYSYSRSYFAEDVTTTGGARLTVSGMQLPDVPKQMATVGMAWQTQGFTVGPTIQYVGPRWADSTYTQKVPGYVVADLSLAYAHKEAWGSWDVSVALMNAFDRKYVGQITTSEVNTQSLAYFPGAPRTLAATVGFKF